MEENMKKFLYIILVSCFSLAIISCAEKDESTAEKDESTTTATTTTTTTTTDTETGVIYQAISVKKKPKKPSIKYTSQTAKPTTTTGFGGITLASTLNFDNAQFGNSKFQ